MALITLMANSWGGKWFDMQWNPQLTSKPWEDAVKFYVDVVTKYGPPGASGNGFNENQALFAGGHCAIWVDATSAAGRLYNKSTSKVADVIGYAKAPGEVTTTGDALVLGLGACHPINDDQGGSCEKLREVGHVEGLREARRKDGRSRHIASWHQGVNLHAGVLERRSFRGDDREVDLDG